MAPAEIPLDKPWKQELYSFAKEKLKHPAWGLAHAERDYLLSMKISEESQLKADADVLFAASFLHDLGGTPEYAKPGVDHADRSAEIAGNILRPMGFPEEKIESVKQAIKTHSYYDDEKPTTPEAVALHDADTLDFLGAIGVARLISITEKEPYAPDLKSSLKLIDRLRQSAPTSIYSGEFAQKLAAQRVAEMDAFTSALSEESYGRRYL